ncbi:DUF4838 domain-containing protein [Aureliella helgolandensis]|uniref:Alpha glucuronidase N-terminal domain-containing protein n=1 Tax=Aureliella helgolandensis TaxID=2527968 RepID=A0A518GD20_9BACT|nr:DUF4838 domain-containing protein [Aureliella helgolandensis]QDV26494.1 hypothetical protein Q31a_48680 [Aureliella helgolandensis]
MKLKLLIFGIAAIWACPVGAASLVTARVAVGEFVLPPNTAAAEAYATKDVRDWIQKITGAEVPIVTEPNASTATKVFVGTAFGKAFPTDLETLRGNDGFAVRRKGNNVYVFGSRPRGTLYGMYALLERNSDLIFARPHEDFGTVHGQSPDFELTDTDFIDIPVFLNRRFGPNWPAHRATGEWLLRNRDNTRDVRANYDGFLNLDLIEPYGTNFAVPIASHQELHPEYFGYDPIKKSRRFVKHGEGTMCLSVPGLPAIWAEGLAEDIAKHEARFGRKVDHVRLGPGDNWFCCQCDRCTAPLALPDGTQLECQDPDSIKDPLFRSTQIMMFINEAMETWQKVRPEVPIHVLAYIHFAEPPRVTPHPDLGIWFAPYPTSNLHYPLLDARQPKPWGRRFEKWLTMTDRLGFYEYFESKPSPQAFYAAANLRAVMERPDHSNSLIYAEISNDFGTDGIGNGQFGWDVGQMNLWVHTRLFWDPTQDVDSLYHYYIQRTYREAAPQMLAYYDLIKTSWLAPDNDTFSSCHASIAGVYQGLIVDRGLEKECMRLLSEAEGAAQHPHSKTMIRRMREQYEGFGKDMARLMIANIPEMRGEADDFDSLQWEKPWVNDDFKLVTRDSDEPKAFSSTKLQAAHDGDSLFLRFRLEDLPPQVVARSGDKAESWPKGDHVEFWLFGGGARYVFAFNAGGSQYDAKDLDRSWDSNWELKVRQTSVGWEAIASIPLSTFQLGAGQPTDLRWFCTREIQLSEQETTEVSYQGKPLYYRNFPIVVE